MQLPGSMQVLFENKMRVVLFFKTDTAPDTFVLKFLKNLPHFKNFSTKHIVIVCHFHFKHKRLEQTEELEVLFSIKKCKIEKICIQDFKNSGNKKNKNKIVFSPNDFFQLLPVFIPKPWGQEIWYSGIESRGVAKVCNLNCHEQSVPISWIAGAVPSLIFGKKFANKDPILIKILDPFAEEVKGDLYYELHLEKNEVYVVTDISSQKGKIKIGINAEKFKFYGENQTKYKEDFLKSILEYEKVRRKIDNLCDSQKEIPKTLNKQEIALRKNMDSFCGYVDLNIGDVINVPTRTPHALQHGVKVIEFQTPTYERLIISFAQKVLTQNCWDTKQSFDEMELKPFQKQPLKILSKTKPIVKELVCDFADFKVLRWTVNAKSKCKISKKSHYRILFVVSGSLNSISQGMCILIQQKSKVILTTKEKCVFLECIPVN